MTWHDKVASYHWVTWFWQWMELERRTCCDVVIDVVMLLEWSCCRCFFHAGRGSVSLMARLSPCGVGTNRWWTRRCITRVSPGYRISIVALSSELMERISIEDSGRYHACHAISCSTQGVSVLTSVSRGSLGHSSMFISKWLWGYCISLDGKLVGPVPLRSVCLLNGFRRGTVGWYKPSVV